MPQGTLEQRKLKVRNIDATTVTVSDLQVSLNSRKSYVNSLLSCLFAETFLEVWRSDHSGLRQKHAWLVSWLCHADLREGLGCCQRDQAVQRRPT